MTERNNSAGSLNHFQARERCDASLCVVQLQNLVGVCLVHRIQGRQLIITSVIPNYVICDNLV